MFCENCGTKLEDGSLFCPNCGQKQDANPVASNVGVANVGTSSYSTNTVNSESNYNTNANAAAASADANSDASYGELVTAFVTGNPAAYGGSNAISHYQKSFDKKGGWNWAGAFLGSTLLVYRKRVAWAFLYWVIDSVIFTIITNISGNSDGGFIFALLAIFLFHGFTVDKVIYRRFKTSMDTALTVNPNNPVQQKVFMASAGGSSITFFVVSIVLVILIMVILVAALGSAVNELSPLIYLFNYL